MPILWPLCVSTVLTGSSEICNFAAYLFADAILVTPLGALSVVICAILSGIFLKERLSFVGKIGCFQCIVGSVVIAANAPEQGAVNTIQDMQKLVISPGFLSYAGVIILACAFIALWLGPRYGKKTMMVYITVCSLIGGLSVVSIQGIGAAITAQARGTDGPQFKNWFIYVLIVFIITTLVTEIIFLNVSLAMIHWRSYMLTTVTESFKFIQRCIGHPNLLCVLYQCNDREFGRTLQRFQRNADPNSHGRAGIPADLHGRDSTSTIEIGKGCARCSSIQR